MHQQPQTDHEQGKQANHYSPKALIRKQDHDDNQANAKYFLNLFYFKNDGGNHGGDYKLNEIREKYINNRNIPSMSFGNKHQYTFQHAQRHNNHGLNIWHLVIVTIVCIFLLLFYFDMKSQYARQLTASKLHLAQCIKKYHENQCDNPVQILQQECKKLKHCYHEEPQQQVKFTVVFAKVITHMIRTLVQDLGMIGIMVVLAVIGIFVWRPKWGNQANVNKVDEMYKIRRD